jgi:zinc transport system ATP-binding protein
MYDLIASLNAEGTTVVMISHDITAAIMYASHILHIGTQSILFFGTKTDYSESDAGHMYVPVRSVSI